MRASPIFALLLALPLLAATVALLPPALFERAEPDMPPEPPEPAPGVSTEWIGAFAAGLRAPSTSQPVAAAENPLEDWRLVGLVQGDEGSWATLTGRGQVRTVTVGDEVGGFELVRIEDTVAVFRRADEERSLRLPR